MSAPVDDGPLTVPAHPYSHRLHDAAAVGRSVPRLHVHMQTAEAVWAVVAVLAPCVFRCTEPAADLAGEGVAACVGLVVPFSKVLRLSSRFMLFPPEDVVTISREEWRVCRFARPPDQATRSGNDLILFKKSPSNVVVSARRNGTDGKREPSRGWLPFGAEGGI